MSQHKMHFHYYYVRFTITMYHAYTTYVTQHTLHRVAAYIHTYTHVVCSDVHTHNENLVDVFSFISMSITE